MAKSDKLYNKSPEIKKGEDGKPGIHRPTPAAKEDIGLAGNPTSGSEGEMPIQVKQTHDMHERHIQEMKDMHKRHEKEHVKLAEDHAGTDASGESLIAKTEGTE